MYISLEMDLNFSHQLFRKILIACFDAQSQKLNFTERLQSG